MLYLAIAAVKGRFTMYYAGTVMCLSSNVFVKTTADFYLHFIAQDRWIANVFWNQDWLCQTPLAVISVSKISAGIVLPYFI
jgi:hypothetical protein